MLENKTAVVTGGTRGIGLSIVKRFLEHGACVALLGSREETVTKALTELSEYSGRTAGFWPDLCSPEEMSATFDEVKSRFGSLDILANNAGIASSTPFTDFTMDEFERIMRLNVEAPFVCSQAAARIMKEQGGGVIISTSSMVSKYGQPAGAAYPMSKYAVNGMTISLARELGRDNIRVNAVAPGVTRTDMLASVPQASLDRISAGIPLGRVGEPEDVANAFVYLASDLAAFVTGTIVNVDGGSLV
ncbi:MAG: 3-oxoacyl-ACP reductase FabG [Clostridia bacterium]|nr:3-oxoacyl-ACP reductase FabG [Clostridia bacterium]